jgi:nucleoside-diphosphate-sugar epimerase
MTQKTVVTGGAGFIGSHIVDALLAEGHQVVVLDDLSTGLRSNLAHVAGDVELVKNDIRDYDLVERTLAGARWVFHEAALGSVPRSIEDPVTTHDINVTGTLNVLRACVKNDVERYVFAASSSTYGDTPVLPKVETMRPDPMSPYAASKTAGEHYAASFTTVYGLPTVCLRYFNIFGPRQRPDGPYAAVIPLFFDRLRRGVRADIYGDGEQTRDFTFVANAVSANLLAAKSGPAAHGKVFNVATGYRVSINQLYDAIAKLLGKPDLRPVYHEGRIGDVRDSLADISAARELLGYEPSVDLETGLASMIP